MLEIMKAIQTKVTNTSALSSPIGGRFYLHRAKRDSAMPYVVLSAVSAVPEFNTSKTFVQPCTLQFAIFCQTIASAEVAITAFRNGFTYQSLSLATGKLMNCVLTNELCLDDPSDDNEADSFKSYILEFDFYQLQAHA